MSDYLDHLGKIKTEQNMSLFNDVKLTNIGRLGTNQSKMAFTLVLKSCFLYVLKSLEEKFKLSFITFLNDSLPRGILPINLNSNRLEQLGKIISETVTKYKKLKGRKKTFP
jgi:hypothetical protein